MEVYDDAGPVDWNWFRNKYGRSLVQVLAATHRIVDAEPVGFMAAALEGDDDARIREAARQMANATGGDPGEAEAALRTALSTYSDVAKMMHDYFTVELPARFAKLWIGVRRDLDEYDPTWRKRLSYSQRLQKARSNLRHKRRKCKMQRKRKGIYR